MSGDELIIRGSKKKVFLVLLIGIGFVAMGAFLIHIGEPWGWLVAGFFGLSIPAAVWMLMPDNNCLKLDRNRVEMRTLWKPALIRWADVDDFYVTAMHGNKMIGIQYSASYRGMEVGRKVASAISGVEGALPDHFQRSPEDICEELNRWRRRFGGARSDP